MKHHNVIVHTLPNPAFNGLAVRQIKQDIMAVKLERDHWYQLNMSMLMLNHRLGRVANHVYSNVAERLNRIAYQRATV